MYRKVASVVMLAAGALVAAAAPTGSRATAVRLELTPRSGTFDVPVTIEASGLPPDAEATVTFSGRAPNGSSWRGERTARVRGGRLDLPDRYVFGLMRRRTPPASTQRITVPASLPHTVRISVRAGGVRASATVRRFSAETLVTSRPESVQRVGFDGVWFLPRHVSGRNTAILLFGGSEGGLVYPYLPATLASRGYPVLDLAYFAAPGLPRQLERIPLEYFRRALKWMDGQPNVDPRRIVSFGSSRGGELSLLLASTFPTLIHGAVGYVPSLFAGNGIPNATVAAWTYRGKPIVGEIPVERIDGPVFVTGGDRDDLSASALYVRMIAQRLHRHGRDDVTALTYPGAGHLIALVLPLSPLLKPNFVPGGSPGADAAARANAWPRLLRFLASIR